MHDGLIQTKLTPPVLPFGLVVRQRLRSRLASNPGRFTLVSAPAGFGKTAVVLDWLQTHFVPTAWLSVDRYDNDPARFFKHLAAAVTRLGIDGAARVAALIETLGQHAAGAPQLQDALSALADDAVLVLDDLHELENEAVLAGVQQLFEPRGSGLRIVALTRVDPPISLARLRVSGHLLELREQDLRFTMDECSALFAQGQRLDDALIEILEQRTEGWAAGLRMAAIALQNAGDPAAAVASFAGSHRLVVDYLVEEAIEKQTCEVQQFLFDTSILEQFTPEACAAITERPNAPAILAEIEAANLFLVPLGNERTWFRYHHLFRELLEFRLRRLNPERVEQLHERAAAWFEQNGDVHSAVEHACRLQDRTRLLELLETHGMSIIARSELATVDRWLQHVPALFTQPYPMMIITAAWLRILTDRAPDLPAMLEAAECALARVRSDYGEERIRHTRAHLNVLRGFAARFTGRFEEALEITRTALEDIPPDDAFMRGLVVYNQARLHMMFGEMQPAARLFEECFEDHLRSGTLYLVLTGLGQAGTVCAQREGLYRAREKLNAAVAFAEQRHLTALPAFSAVLYHRASVEYQADALDDAFSAATRAVELSRAGNFPEGYANGVLVLLRVEIARRRFHEADTLLTELAALAQNRNIVLMDSTVALEQMRLAMARELCSMGPSVPRLVVDPEQPGWTLVRETEVMLALAQALHVHNHDYGARLAERLRTESAARGRGVALCVALAAQAITNEAARWETLDHALRLAAARGYVRALLDLAEVIVPLLQAANSRALSAEARAFARALLQRQGRPTTIVVEHLAEPLTAREEEVLRYLRENMSNKAIARGMFVSTETVKTHLKHLYWKLGATNRREALERAQVLGLTTSQQQ